MQSIWSVAGIVLAVAGPGESITPSKGGDPAVGAANSGWVVAWNIPNHIQSGFRYGLPRAVPPPRIPRPRWPK
jgi:hypothetical protein